LTEGKYSRKNVLKERLNHLNAEILYRFNALKSLDFSKDYAKLMRARNDLKHLHKLKDAAFDELVKLNSLA
jgi:hypothetical protein